MWIYVVTSFTRYSKVGREAQKLFDRDMQKDGFHHLHSNLYVRYCSTSSNAAIHKERVRGMIPSASCDISIIMSSDSLEQNTYHCINRRRKKRILYGKPFHIEFF
jgi:CRISPR/Cas system-associated protein endoribonuclease Cas2